MDPNGPTNMDLMNPPLTSSATRRGVKSGRGGRTRSGVTTEGVVGFLVECGQFWKSFVSAGAVGAVGRTLGGGRMRLG